MDMGEEYHQMEIAMKDSLTIMICMDMGSILTWSIRRDMKEYGREGRSLVTSKCMIE